MDLSLSPSSSSRWLTCTASPVFIAENKDRLPKESSQYSEEGVKAHYVAAAALLMGPEVIQELCDGDLAMAKHIKEYHSFVTSKRLHDDEFFVETKVPVWFNPHKNGYIDSLLLNSKRLYITDLKYGEGVAVFARGNTQLAIYMKSVITYFESMGMGFDDDFLITCAVFQPRCRRGEKISIWTMSYKELNVFVRHIEDTAIAIKTGAKRDFRPSDSTCQFCRAQSICSARSAQLFGAATESILPVGPPDAPIEAVYLSDPATLPPATVSYLLENAPSIRSWLEKITKYARAALDHGKPELVDNKWKLVEGREGNRMWSDPVAAEAFLRKYLDPDVVRPPATLISPKQAEDLLEDLGKPKAAAKLASFVKRDPGKPTLAPANDPRPPFAERHGFTDLNAEDLL
jgi:hypothetical protein